MKKIYVTKASLPDINEYIDYLKDIWDSAVLTNMGKLHNELEEKLTDIFETKYCRLFTNGHLALEMALQAYNFKGEVITTPYSFASTVHAISRNGLKPVFCDIKLDDFTIDENKIEDLINENTVAILPVHVYGNICNYKAIERIARKYNLKVIYDAAHTFYEKIDGRSVASLGDMSMFSFHATKAFNTVEGGAIALNDESLYQELYYLKNFGIEDKEIVNNIGGNAKMSEFQAAMGLCNLRHIAAWIEKRKKIAQTYISRLKEVDAVKLNDFKANIEYNYAYFPIIVKDNSNNNRNKIYEKLIEKGIYTRKYFYPLISDYKCYKDIDNSDLKNAKYCADRVLTLPIYPDLDISDVEMICDEIIKLC